MTTPRIEPEILWGRRAFPEAQKLLEGSAVRRINQPISTSWHDTSVQPELGAFCVVRDGAGLDDLIGEILHVEGPKARAVNVYCLGSADVPGDLSLARRPFLALALLSSETIDTLVTVLG